MFTGIILHSASLEALEHLDNGARLRLRTTFDEPFERGESLAVNGVCLTVLPQDDGSLVTEGEFAVYRWSYPREFGDLVVNKGSIAVDGISLTIIDPEGGQPEGALM